MNWAFQDTDGDGLSNALEIGWDTHPEKSDTDGDGHSDMQEISIGTNPDDSDSHPLNLYIPLVTHSTAKG